MGYHAVLDADGVPQGFYLEGLHKAIPVEAVPITDAQWQALNAGGPARLERATGKVVPHVVPPPPPSPQARQRRALEVASARQGELIQRVAELSAKAGLAPLAPELLDAAATLRGE